MGYIRHDAIIVTCFNEKVARSCRRKAKLLKLEVTNIVISNINCYSSFLITPDGSKEGWGESDNGDSARDEWKFWVKKTHGNYVDWIHVSFGGDEPENAHIVEYNEYVGEE